MTIHKLSQISELKNKYRCFALDQFGVLHNGLNPYPSAVDCLLQMNKYGLYVVVLTNSSKSESENYSRLRSIGIPTNPIKRIITAGDVANYYISNGLVSELSGRFKPHIFPSSFDAPFESRISAFSKSHILEEADYVILTSAKSRKEIDSLKRIIFPTCLARKLPLVVVNSERKRIFGKKVLPGCGLLADYYQAYGGSVIKFGKPDIKIFQKLTSIVHNFSPTLVVGDTLSEDIAGAKNAKLDSLLVTCGVVKQVPCHPYIAPDYVISHLTW